jgi:hypothetical protein
MGRGIADATVKTRQALRWNNKVKEDIYEMLGCCTQ